MAPDDPRDISPSRKALLGVYAALNPKLRQELTYVQVEFPEPLDAYAQLQAVAKNINQRKEQLRPPVPRLQLAFALMDVMERAPRRLDDSEQFRPVIAALLNPRLAPDDSVRGADLILAFERAANRRMKDRWASLVEEFGTLLHADLSIFTDAQCDSELRSVDGEVASKVETKQIVQRQKDFRLITPAMLPHNWPRCNDFFCTLIRTPDRDAALPGTTGGDPLDNSTHWRGVYEERVGTCPAGWFPDTFLIFGWDLSENQLVLRYQLAPRRAGDRTVLRIDEGYIQVDVLPDSYEVSTLKYLLFDEKFIPGGGQTLGAAACELGWLDHAINQFTCADAPSPHPSVDPSPDNPEAGFDASLQQVLERCESNLRQSTADAQGQFGTAMKKIQGGTYSLDDVVQDCGAAAVRAMRDGSLAVRRQIEFAARALELANVFTRQKDNKS